MERLTNDLWKFYEQARLEIFDLPENKRSRLWVRLAVIPSFHNWFTLSVIKEDNNQLSIYRKEWDAGYDFTRFKLQIYHLDCLRIVHSQRDLNPEESQILTRIIRDIENTPLPDSLKGNEIIIDGVTYELELSHLNKQYEWRLFNEKTKVIEPLTDYLVKNEEKKGKACKQHQPSRQLGRSTENPSMRPQLRGCLIRW